MASVDIENEARQEFLWSCILSESNKEYVWDAYHGEQGKQDAKEDKEGEDQGRPEHKLLIKSAVITEGQKDEVTVVQVEAEGFNKMKIKIPIVVMKSGQDMRYLDVLIPCTAKLSLVQGKGPVHLLGSHCIENLYDEAIEDEENDVTNGDEAVDDNSEVKSPNKDSKIKDGDKKSDSTPVKDDSKKRKSSSSEQQKSDEIKAKTSPAK